jgi:hypothetical protein
MIRVDIGPRVFKAARRLGPEVTVQAEKKISAVAAQFGNPHAHAGLGLRKIGRRSYEIRVWLQWRVVFIHEGDRLTAYDIMSHREVRAWLKQRGGR